MQFGPPAWRRAALISNPELKGRIRLAAEAEEKKSYEHRMSREWLEALEILGTDWHKTHIEQAPYIIVVFAHHYWLVTRTDGAQRKVKHYYVQESVGIAVGILLSSLAHAGLATLTHTPSPMSFLNASRQDVRGNDTMGERMWKSEEKEEMCDSPNHLTPIRDSNPCRVAPCD